MTGLRRFWAFDILRHRRVQDGMSREYEFLVQWVGFSKSLRDTSWAREVMADCAGELLAEYLEGHGLEE